MAFFLAWIILLANVSYLKASNSSTLPHLVIIYADDLGWNDVSFHGSPQVPTPNIDALALNGIALHNYYGEWLCSPSRGALLTGKYPMRLGLQHNVLLAGEAVGLPLNETLMPQYFKKFGYQTHMIGKWHLGYHTKKYTPTYRGFDTFFGYWNAQTDYYDHTYFEKGCSSIPLPLYGLDLHDGLTPVRDAQGVYATHLFTDRTEKIIRDHDTSKPLFLYLAHAAVHAGNSYQLSQAPGDVVAQFKDIRDVRRRVHAGVIKVLDDSVGAVFNALHQKNMLDNTILLFLSDNGAEANPAKGFGSNYPLRGNKHTHWEGGVRLPALLWSPLLKLRQPRIARQLMHVSDWLPTLYSITGGNLQDLGPIDGINMWPSLVSGAPSPRTDLLQNLDSISGTSALRRGHMKLVRGSPPNPLNFWYDPSDTKPSDPPATYERVFRNGSVVRDILKKRGLWIAERPDDVYRNLLVRCARPVPEEAFRCNASVRACLFNVTDDPCEYHDMADKHPGMVDEMSKIIQKYQSEEMKPQVKDCDASANPMCHQFLYVPWLDPEYSQVCDFLTEKNSTKTSPPTEFDKSS